MTGLEIYLPLETSNTDISGNGRTPGNINGGPIYSETAIGPCPRSGYCTKAGYESLALWQTQWAWLRTQVTNDAPFTIDGFYKVANTNNDFGSVVARSGWTSAGSGNLGFMVISRCVYWNNSHRGPIVWSSNSNGTETTNWLNVNSDWTNSMYFCTRYDGENLRHFLRDLTDNATRINMSPASWPTIQTPAVRMNIGVEAAYDASTGGWTWHNDVRIAHIGYWSRELTDAEVISRYSGDWLPTSL